MSPPTLYEYYTGDGIKSGLSTAQLYFILNNKEITIYSGALHYFRVPRSYWRDRLRKLRAAGLNAVETYIPWNLHEPEPGVFDFGSWPSDFTDFLALEEFLKLAQEEDLFVIIRPGPYICAEWDLGGLPSWLLRSGTKVRTSDAKFMEFVRGYFGVLIPKLAALQFTKNGPIIAVQIENEYGNTKTAGREVDTGYLLALKAILEDNGIVEVLFTSDTPSNGFSGTLPEVLATANFQDEPIFELTLLKEHQPNKPLMVMEYWTGWFDHWSEQHHTRPCQKFSEVLDQILSFNSSVNMYMFHGGTNWGFLNGGNLKDSTTDNSSYLSDTTSYDYDAPLSEAGDYTDKYYAVKDLIGKHNKVITKIPELPPLVKRVQYPVIKFDSMLTIDDLICRSEYSVKSSKPLSMELLELGNQSGQSYGYIVYRKTNVSLPSNAILTIGGHVCDTVFVLINGEPKMEVPKTQDALNKFGFWRLKDSSLCLGPEEYENATVDLVVENFGRANYGKLEQFNQFKGLWQGDVLVNGTVLEDWEVVPLQFKTSWVRGLSGWRPTAGFTAPGLYKAEFRVEEIADTFLDMRGWTKGTVVVNGFVLGRHFQVGPQQALYLPGPLLLEDNEILVFEHFESNLLVKSVTEPIFETLD